MEMTWLKTINTSHRLHTIQKPMLFLWYLSEVMNIINFIFKVSLMYAATVFFCGQR